jgi:hypothetical protein
MKDLLIKSDQLQQLFAFLQEQPHKFSAPMIAYFKQLMNEQEKEDQPEGPLSDKVEN